MIDAAISAPRSGADRRPLRSVKSARDEVRLVPINALVAGDTPRLAGEDGQHARMLADSGAQLPPILVHRRTMRVIDGMHRLRAAQLTGRSMIDAVFFEGTDEDAFVQAVRENVAHGLPLSLSDREAAAMRIISSHSHWSDRAIAAVAGLAPKTVGALRRRNGNEVPQTSARIGRDGRVRPINAREGRRIAGEIISQRPDASLREIAKAAGISPTTARDVRNRLLCDGHSQPELEAGPQPEEPQARSAMRSVDKAAVIRSLSKDPSLRFKETGRTLLQWLVQHSNGLEEWIDLLSSIPPHCSYALADLAQECAAEWIAFAGELRKRVGAME